LPFANVNPRDDGSCQVQYLQSADVYNPASAQATYQAGITGTVPLTPLAEFQAVFTATVSVVTTGTVTFGAIVDDAAVLAIGPRLRDRGATTIQPTALYSPTLPPTLTATLPVTSPFQGYKVIAGFYPYADGTTNPKVLTTTVNFPQPGVYPIEVDYVQVKPGSQLSMILTADTGTASRLTGDRDCGACDASVTAADNASAINAQLAVHKPFNSRTGNYFRTDTDLTDPTPGRPLIWARTYNSQAVGDPTTPPVGLGPGWQDPYATRIITTSGVITVVSPEGNLLQFLDQGDGAFRPFPGVDATLTQNADGSYTENTWAQESVTFTPAGMPTLMTDAHGRSLRLIYDGQGRLTTVQDATPGSSRALTISYDGSNRISTVSDEVGQAVQYSYDGAGNLTGVANLSGHPASPLTYTYATGSGQPLLTDVVNALGQTTEHTVYDSGAYTPARVSSQTEQDGTTVSATYGATATTLTTTAPAGQPNPTPDGGPMVETITYDPNTDAMTGVSINGVTMESTQFDANFDPAVVADGDGNSHATVVTYNRLGLPLSIADPVSGTTAISYDDSLNPLTVTDGLGRMTVNQYDASNDLMAQTTGITTGSPGTPASAGSTTTFSYNGAAQPTDMTAPDGTVTHNDYTAQGELVTQTVGYNLAPDKRRVTTYGYDTMGRRTDTTTGYGLPVQRTDHTVYNDDGTIAQTVQNYVPAGQACPLAPCNVSTSYGYDALGRQLWTRDALGRYSVTHYDAAGQTDWTLRNAADPMTGLPTLPANLSSPSTPPPAYQASLPDANVATRYGYDALGRQALVTRTGILTGTFNAATQQFSDTTTRVTRTDYDLMGRPMTTTQNLMGSSVFDPAHPDQNVQAVTQYDAAGNVTWQRDALGRWTHTEYDGDNRPVTTTVNYENGDPTSVSPSNTGWTNGSDSDLLSLTTYNADGSVNQRIDNYVPGTQFTASAPITDRVTKYGYDSQGRVVTTTVNSDPNDRAAAGRADLNRTTLTAYDATSGRAVGQQDTLGRWTSLQYDLLGEQTGSVRNCTTGGPAGSPTPTGCASYDAGTPAANLGTGTVSYDALGRASQSTDARGYLTQSAYDGLGRTVAMTQNATGAPYDPAHPDQDVATGTAYDALGRTVATTDALGSPTTYGYNGLDQTVAVTTQVTLTATRTTQTGYDGTGATRWTQGPDGQLTVYQVDGLGRVITTTRDYTGTGQPMAGRTDLNLATGTVYDAAGRAVETIDPANHVISNTYNLRDQLVQSIQNDVGNGTSDPARPDQNITTLSAYDHAGDRISSTDALNHTTTYGYDAAGEQTSTTDPLGYTTAISYDVGGRAITTTDPLGRQSVSAYDGLDEVISQTTGITTGATGTMNHPAVPASVGATATYTYSYGLRTDSVGPDGVDTQQGVDALGRTMATTVGVGTAAPRITLYGLDADGRVVTATTGLTSTASGVTSPLRRLDVTGYNADGSISQTIQDYTGSGASDPAHPDQNVATSYGYDAAGRQAWTRDALGRYSATHYDAAGRQGYTVRTYAPATPPVPFSPLPATPPAYTAAMPDQNVATFYGYDLLGQQTLVTQTGILTGTFNAATQQFSAVATRTTGTAYDAVGRPLTTTQNLVGNGVFDPARPDQNVGTARQYDAAGNTLWQVDALNRWTTTGYDADNRPVTTTVNFENGDPTTVDPANRGWTDGSDSDLMSLTRYNADGSVTQRIDNYVPGTTFTASAPLTDRVTLFGYDGQGRALTSTVTYDPPTLGLRADTNRTTVTAYDARGRAVGQQDPLGRWASTGYDALGQATRSVRDCTTGGVFPIRTATGCAAYSTLLPDQNLSTGTQYDALGRASQSTDARGLLTQTRYDGVGRAIAVTQNYRPTVPASADTNVSTGTAYDALGRTTVTTDAVGSPTTYAYNGLDQTVAVTTQATLTATRTSQTGYDGTGATRWTQGPDGSYTVYQTDGLGRVITATRDYTGTGQPVSGRTDLNLSTGTVYDAAGRAVETIDPAGRVVSTTYNLRDQLVQSIQNYVPAGQPCLQPPCNVTTSATYDHAGDRISSTDADGHTTTYRYDAAGEQTTTTDALGYITATGYDVGGRAVTTTDPLGRQSVSAYDDLDEVISQTTGITTGATGAYQTTGTTSVYTYSYGLQTDRSGPDGVDTRQQYDGLGRVVTSTLGYGTGLDQVTATGYDATGRAVTSTVGAGTPLQRQDVTQYNPDGSITQTIQNETGSGQFDPAHPDRNVATVYGYDAAGRQAWTQDPLGRYSATHYNAAGQADWTARDFVPATPAPLPPVVTLPATPPAFTPQQPDQNVTTFYGYDTLGQQTLVTQTGILTGTFDPVAQAFTGATTRTTLTQYDAVGHAITTTLNDQPGALPDAQPGQAPDAASDTNLRTVTRYDLAGNVTWRRDPLGRWDQTQYDADNRPVTETVNFENGDPTTVDPANRGWTNGTDTDLRAVTHYRPDGSVDLRTDNDVPGTSFTATAPLTDVATQYSYDPQGQPTGTTQVYDPATGGTGGTTGTGATNRSGATAYDSLGRPYETTDALGHVTSTSYDLLSRPLTVTQNYSPTAPASADTNVATGTRYDALGRVSETVDPLGYVAHTAYDGLGRTVAVTQNYAPGGPSNADTNVTARTAYDAAGEVLSTTDALGRPTLYDYDGLGQTLDTTDPAGLITHTVSDATGAVRWSLRPGNRLTVRAVDGLGRVVGTTQNDAPGAPATAADANLTTGTVYDAAGRPVQTTDVANRVTQTGYDLRDAPLSVTRHYVAGAPATADTNVTTLYGYDRAGDRVSITDPDSHVATYGYDAAHEQTGATDALGRQTTYSYDALGRLTGRGDGRGASDAVSYGYDALGRTTTISAPALSAPIAESYNARGDRLGLSDGSGAGSSGPTSTTFGHDALGRTTAVTQAGGLGVVSYGYDAAGQRTGLTDPAPDTTALTYAYNGDGQLTTVITAGVSAGPSTPALASYGYDGVGRLTTLTQGNGSLTRYGYDGADRLLDKQTVVGGLQQSRYSSVVDRLGRVTALTETTALQANGQTPVLAGQAYVPPALQATSGGIGTMARSGRTIPQPQGQAPSWQPSSPVPPSLAPSLPGSSAPLGPGPTSNPTPASPSAPATTSAPRAPHSGAGTTPPGGAGVAPVPAVPAPPVVSPPTPGSAPHPSPATAFTRRARLGPLPLRFEANRGQTAPAVRYLVRGAGYTLFLTPTDATLTLIGGQTWTGHPQSGNGLPHGRRVALRLQLVGANTQARVEGQGRQAGRTAYLRGHGWSGLVPTYAQVRVRGVYHGIDLVYHGREGTLEYDWLLRPGADARAIRLAVAGARGLRLDPQGALLIATAVGTLRQERPVAYQTVRGHRIGVTVRYVLWGRDRVGLRLGRYDHRLPLTIDPVLRYSSYLGGSAADAATAVALDAAGNLYLTGYTASPDITATGGFTTTAAGASYDAFVTKLDRTGKVVYSDYLGGSGSDAGWGIAVDGQGSAYVTGQTGSADFPTTSGALTVTAPLTTSDAFVVKLSADGSRLVYGMLLGSTASVLTQGSLRIAGLGDTWGRAIAVDASGVAYLTGQTDSASFPVTIMDPRYITATVGALLLHGSCTLTPPSGQAGGPCYDAFVTELGPSGTISYSTYLGGGRDDYGYGIATDGRGTVYVTGCTESRDFPISGTLQGFNQGNSAACHETDCPDAFVARLDTTMSFTAVGTLGSGGVLGNLGTLLGGSVGNLLHPSLLWSSYLGGSGADEGTGIALDPSGNVYVTGDTAPTSAGTRGDFPVTTGAYSTTTVAGTCPAGPCADVFVAKLPNDGSRLIYASRFGGGGDDKGTALAVDTAGHAYVTGSTSSADFPVLGSLQGFSGTMSGALTATMAFVTRLNTQGSALWYSTLLGGSGGDAGAGIAVDGVGDVAVAGQTGSADLLTARAASPWPAQALPARQAQLGGTQGGQGQSQGQPDAFVATLDATTRHLAYGYDTLQRLTGVTETLGNAYTYAYDLAGNRTDATVNGLLVRHASYDAANQVLTATALGATGPVSDSYDGAGNLTGDGSAAYRYDALDRLTGLTAPSLGQTEAYTYNGDGALVAQAANGAATRYTQDLATAPAPSDPSSAAGTAGSTGGAAPALTQVLQTTTGTSGGTPTDYLYGASGPTGDGRLASTTSGSGTHAWSVADLQGSVRYSQDDSGQPSGAALAYDPRPLRYDPFGAIDRGADGTGRTPTTFGYRGEVQDASTGLVNLRARMYNPATGQFLTRDPLEQQTGQAYSYASNDPVNNSDPPGACQSASLKTEVPLGGYLVACTAREEANAQGLFKDAFNATPRAQLALRIPYQDIYQGAPDSSATMARTCDPPYDPAYCASILAPYAQGPFERLSEPEVTCVYNQALLIPLLRPRLRRSTFYVYPTGVVTVRGQQFRTGTGTIERPAPPIEIAPPGTGTGEPPNIPPLNPGVRPVPIRPVLPRVSPSITTRD